MASARSDVLVPATRPLPRRPSRTPHRAEARERGSAPARTRTRVRPRSRGAIMWIVVGAALLGGVVFVNLAVLRTNLRLEQTDQAVVQMNAENQQLYGELSVASAAGRIEALARARDGLVQANPSSIGYIDLASP